MMCHHNYVEVTKHMSHNTSSLQATELHKDNIIFAHILSDMNIQVGH